VELSVQREAPESVHILQRLEYGAEQLAGKVHFSRGAVVEAKPDAVAGKVARVDESRERHSHSKGPMRCNRSPALW
jgi:hypothetical protein